MGTNGWDSLDLDHPVIFSGTSVLRARIDEEDGVVMVSLVGEFDLAAEDSFTTVLNEIEATNPRAIALNLRGLSFIDSSGVRSLVKAHDRANGSHAFAVLNGSGPAHRILTITGLNERLLMVEHIQELYDRVAAETD